MSDEKYDHWAALDAFGKARGMRMTTKTPHPAYLHNNKRREFFQPTTGNWNDHGFLWTKNKIAVMTTYEPYRINWEQMQEIREFACEYELAYVIIEPDDDTSIWFPGSTWFIAFARKGYEDLLPLPVNRRRQAILEQQCSE